MEDCVERVKYLKGRHKIDLRAFEETESDSLLKLNHFLFPKTSFLPFKLRRN